MSAVAEARPGVIHRTTTTELRGPPARERAAYASGPAGPQAHAAAVAEVSALRAVEFHCKPASPDAESLTIAFWNAERCKYVEASAALLQRAGAGLVLLAEMDHGMARSGQRHTTRDLAECLGWSYAFATEFVELGLGDARERSWHASQTNAVGLHGNSIVANRAFSDPAVIRLPETGQWFGGALNDERRIGGRIATAAKTRLDSGPVALICVHLESHGDPQSRACETQSLLAAVDEYADGIPVLIGGDFNTKTADRNRPDWTAEKQRIETQSPGRLTDPVPYEPLFKVMADHGFDWSHCNAEGATERTRADGTPQPPFAKLDWFFSRDLVCTRPAIIPAVADDGSAISDHELIVIEISRSKQ